MWPSKFDYVRAGSVDEALASAADGGKFLAGGHSLLPAMKLRLDAPEQLIDIGRIPELQEHLGQRRFDDWRGRDP